MKISPTQILLVLILALGCMIGCDNHTPVVSNNNGGTVVSDGFGSCTVYIIEKQGHKFAVAVGIQKCSIVEIKD